MAPGRSTGPFCQTILIDLSFVPNGNLRPSLSGCLFGSTYHLWTFHENRTAFSFVQSQVEWSVPSPLPSSSQSSRSSVSASITWVHIELPTGPASRTPSSLDISKARQGDLALLGLGHNIILHLACRFTAVRTTSCTINLVLQGRNRANNIFTVPERNGTFEPPAHFSSGLFPMAQFLFKQQNLLS